MKERKIQSLTTQTQEFSKFENLEPKKSTNLEPPRHKTNFWFKKSNLEPRNNNKNNKEQQDTKTHEKYCKKLQKIGQTTRRIGLTKDRNFYVSWWETIQETQQHNKNIIPK